MTNLMIKIIHFLVVIVLLTGCAKDGTNNLDYTIVKVQFQSTDCQPETDACLMVTMAYPQFNQGDSLAQLLANRIIRNSILDNIGMGDAESTTEPSVNEAIEELSKSFEELIQDVGSYTTGWQADIKADEIYRSDSVLVFEVASMTFFGGAHPNSNVRYFNFDRSTGRYLPITFFVDDLTQFSAKAEAVFRKVYNLKEGSTYEEAGFDFLGNKFTLAANYAFLGDSIRLHYNQYEIAPYAAGDFEVTVSLK
jgi:Protein of unknown function (DUF3298)/Deacetylase PdaC